MRRDLKRTIGYEAVMMLNRFTFSLILAALALFAGPIAEAQTVQTAEVTQTPHELEPRKDNLSIQEQLQADMIAMPDIVQALTQNLGQLHYLRTLCFGKTDQKWRDYAAQMMEIEAPKDADQRRQLIQAFNTGYYDQQDRHLRCSEAVSGDAAAIAENARHLAAMLGDPYRE